MSVISPVPERVTATRTGWTGLGGTIGFGGTIRRNLGKTTSGKMGPGGQKTVFSSAPTNW
ncbi:hypothetical protein SAMN05428944_3619 [Streptomyces sp. 1222.5]|nr:hypothetical protein BX260_4474 [Streptomyces sp. 5112.2]SEC41141.1 hypothetical protein SAMN05428944_3619 [Streptomyces sp. 1222.5]